MRSRGDIDRLSLACYRPQAFRGKNWVSRRTTVRVWETGRPVTLQVLQERARDRDEVEALYDLAFAPGRSALSSYQLRDGVEPVAELCLLARDDYDVVAGAIRYWPIEIGEEALPAVLLGPVAVHPTRQGEGLGALLILESLEIAEKLGWRRVVLIGDEPYYRRFGFRRSLAEGLRFPPPTNPNRILALALAPGAMDGVAGEVRKTRQARKADEGRDGGPDEPA